MLNRIFRRYSDELISSDHKLSNAPEREASCKSDDNVRWSSDQDAIMHESTHDDTNDNITKGYEKISRPTQDELALDMNASSLEEKQPPSLSADTSTRSYSRKRYVEENETPSAKRRQTPPLRDSDILVKPTKASFLSPSPPVNVKEEPVVDPTPKLLKELDTKPITIVQLIPEVKAVYSGLVLVENKCIEIVGKQNANPTDLLAEQCQALAGLHRTYLNEQYDFFSATHHPITKSNSPDKPDHELRGLTVKYSMAARLWRHGIHGFLELLRHRLPGSLEHMLSFLYLAYSMVALLMETVPDFQETWIECLGDLARYRMAIEEADPHDRMVWCETARSWYHKAADLSPNTGRIQHHLAVLARPDIVQQLFLYSKALVASIPFRNAAESILLLFKPLLDSADMTNTRYAPADFALVCSAATLSMRRPVSQFRRFRTDFSAHLEAHIGRTGNFKVQGPEISGSLFAMVMDFGGPQNKLFIMLEKQSKILRDQYCAKYNVEVSKLPKDFVVQDRVLLLASRDQYWKNQIIEDRFMPSTLAPDQEIRSSDEVTALAAPMLYETISSVAKHIGNRNMIPFIYMTLAYLVGLSFVPGAIIYIEAAIPWSDLIQFLNTIANANSISFDMIESDEFPKLYGGTGRQLPEEFVMRGLMVMSYFFPADWFSAQVVDHDERMIEQPSQQATRIERCLWAGVQLAKFKRWIIYNRATRQFAVTPLAQSLCL